MEDGENSLYKNARLSYMPRGGPFVHLNELWLVQGLPASLVERALPHLTIFSGRPDINVLDASPEVIAALPGLSAGRLDTFLALRSKIQPDWQSDVQIDALEIAIALWQTSPVREATALGVATSIPGFLDAAPSDKRTVQP